MFGVYLYISISISISGSNIFSWVLVVGVMDISGNILVYGDSFIAEYVLHNTRLFVCLCENCVIIALQ
jgi:hypothetical protein